MNVLHLLPDFGHHAAARQVSLLAPELATAGCSVHAAALGSDGPLSAPLRSAGIAVHVLGGRRWDPLVEWHLHRLVAEVRPDVIHTWRLPAIRAAGLLHRFSRRSFWLIVSEPRRGGLLNVLDRWLLRRADAVIASHTGEKEALHRLGLAADRVHVWGLAAAPPPSGPSPPLDVPLPPGARLVMCVGALTPAHGFRDAVWAADILKYAVPNLHVVIFGDDPERQQLRQFIARVHRARGEEFIHLRAARPDAAALFPQADVVWVPSRSECGQQVLLEALAAGRPVVASALPGLTALVGDGVSGLLTPPGDPPALVRQTRRLFDDPELAHQLGAAGQKIAAARSPTSIVEGYVWPPAWLPRQTLLYQSASPRLVSEPPNG